MENKTICILLLFFLSFDLFAQSEKNTSIFILKTDILAPLRGNRTASFVLDYSSHDSSLIVHSFGIDMIYDYSFSRNEKFPSRPTIKIAPPSGAIFYNINRKVPGARLGIQALAGNYRYRYSRYVCLESEELSSAVFCKCTNWTINEFDYQNLKFSLAGTIGIGRLFQDLFFEIKLRLGSYLIVPIGERNLLDDRISCPNIGNGGESSSALITEGDHRAMTHYTADFSNDLNFKFLSQVSINLGYKF